MQEEANDNCGIPLPNRVKFWQNLNAIVLYKDFTFATALMKCHYFYPSSIHNWSKHPSFLEIIIFWRFYACLFLFLANKKLLWIISRTIDNENMMAMHVSRNKNSKVSFFSGTTILFNDKPSCFLELLPRIIGFDLKILT